MKMRLLAFLTFLCCSFVAHVAISAEPWSVLVEQGDKASERGDYDAALSLYLAAAKLGHPFAMNAVGSTYLNKGDPRRAFMWCTLAGTKFGHATDFGCLARSESALSEDEIRRLNDLAVQCLASNYKSCERLDPSQQANIAAYYATKCRVADPTGTKLNLRTSPNGKIITTIENGISVTIIDTATDSQGREWTYLERDESGMALGWAFKRYLSCGRRADVQTAGNQEVQTPAYVPAAAKIVEIIPTSNRSPSNERAPNALDGNANTKYLNFDKFNAGLTIRFDRRTTLVSMRLTTANDYPGRDPTSLTLRGSNDGRSWDDIVVNMPISLPTARRSKGPVFALPPQRGYEFFQITFPTVKNMSRSCGFDCDSMQIADIELSYD